MTFGDLIRDTLRTLMAHSAQRALASGVRPGEFHEWVPGVTFMATSEAHGQMHDVVFMDQRDAKRPVVISAKEGHVGVGERAEDMVFDLKQGTILLHDSGSEVYRVLKFETSRYRLDFGSLVGNKARTLSPVQEKSIGELWRDSHDPDLPRNRRALHTITFHRRIALPFAAIIFSLLAVPLAVRAQGGARARGFLYSAGIVGAYYYVGRAAELAARGGAFDAVAAAWLPNLLGLVALLCLLPRLRRRAM